MRCKLVYGPAHGKHFDFANGMQEAVIAIKGKAFKDSSLIDPHRRVVRYRRVGEVNGKELAIFVGNEGT